MSLIKLYKRKLKESLDMLDLFTSAIKNDRSHRVFYTVFLSLIGLSILLDSINLEEYDIFGIIGVTGILLYSGNLYRTVIPSGSEFWQYRILSFWLIGMGILSFFIFIFKIVPFFFLLPWRIWSFGLSN